VKRARAGHGPSLIESKFYRFSAHGNAITVPPVPTQFPEHEAIETYGKKSEYAAARARDPILLFRKKLRDKGFLSEQVAKRIEESVRAELQEAVQFALASPFPAPEEAMKHVFA
jgi:TPP-dependent pyruvate/acetoin dehydrogenase alpha subunit